MKKHNFKKCFYRNLSGGIVSIHSGWKDLMLKKLITLFKLGRKIAKSDILKITSKFQEPPLLIKYCSKFYLFLFSTKTIK